MKWLLLVALVAFPALGADIRFDTDLRLGGTGKLIVTGVAETSGQATLVVLRTGAVVQVPLQLAGDRLESSPIHLRRPSDCDPAGSPFLLVQLGDTVAAATELGGGLAVTAAVGPRQRRPGEPTLALERWDNVDMKWIPATEIEPALFRIVVGDTPRDVTCDRERFPLSVVLAGKEFALDLTEEALASGTFAGEFVVKVEPAECSLVLSVTTVDRKSLLEAPALPGAGLAARYGGVAVQAPVVFLLVELAPKDPVIRVGCVGEVRVVAPARPDEVRWCVDGRAQRHGGEVLPLYGDGPRVVSVVALVRNGLLWGRAETAVTFVRPVALTLVDAATAVPATEPWPCAQPIRIRAEHVSAAPVVLVGRLGPDPRVQKVDLVRTAEGAFESGPIRPADFGACAGDVLWVQLKDPRGCYPVYITLSLR